MTASAGRLASVDFWRGIALATIFINHVPGNPLESFTHKNFGYSDAADAFVFLAGMGVALAYAGRMERGEGLSATLALLKRCLKLYAVHLGLIVVCGGLLAYAAAHVLRPGLPEGTGFESFWSDPLRALRDVALLTLQPAYFNILPLYVGLLLVAPALLALLRVDLRLGLAASASLWLGAHLAGWTIGDDDNHGWYFNPLAWQLIFTAGLAAGLLARRRAEIFSSLLFKAAVAWLAVSVLWVKGGFVLPVDMGAIPGFLVESNKANASLPRLLHAAALFYVASQLPLESVLRRADWARPFILMGRNALPVFCLLSVLSFAAQIARNADEALMTYDVALVSTGLLLIAGFAWLLDRRTALARNAGARTA